MGALLAKDSFNVPNRAPFTQPRGRSAKMAFSMTERLYYTDSYLREFHARAWSTAPRTASPSTSTAPPSIPARAGSPSIPAPSAASRWSKWWTRTIASRTAWPRPWPGRRRSSAPSIGTAASITCSSIAVSTCSPRSSKSGSASTPSASTWARRAPPSTSKAARVDAAHRPGGGAPRQPDRLRKPPAGRPFRGRRRGRRGCAKRPERQGTLRIVSIDGLDRSACGGTHVRATGEIGVVLLRKLEKIRQSVRVEFLCGSSRGPPRARRLRGPGEGRAALLVAARRGARPGGGAARKRARGREGPAQAGTRSGGLSRAANCTQRPRPMRPASAASPSGLPRGNARGFARARAKLHRAAQGGVRGRAHRSRPPCSRRPRPMPGSMPASC